MGVIGADTVVVATADQVSCDLDGEAAVLHLASGMYFGLDGTGATVWALLQQAPQRVADLTVAVVDEFAVEREVAQRDILAFLEDLRSHGLVDVAAGADGPPAPR